MLVFFTSLAAGLLFTWLVFPRLGDATSGIDPDGYGAAGQVLYQTGRFDDLHKAPLYPVFVALVCWTAGGCSLAALQFAQCLLAALACAVLYLLFRRTLRPPQAALPAALACAVYPMLLWYVPRLWTETFLTLMLAVFSLALAALLQDADADRALQPGAGLAAAPAALRLPLRGLLAGSALGALMLSKGIAMLFAPLSLLALAAAWGLWVGSAGASRASSAGSGAQAAGLCRARWLALVVYLLAALAWVLPWTERNYRLSGQFIPIHLDGGYNFYLGNGFARHFTEAPLSYVELKALTNQDLQADYLAAGGRPADPAADDRLLLRLGLAQLAARPALALRKALVGLLSFWYLAGDPGKSLLTGALQLPLLLAALPGVYRSLRCRLPSRLLLLPLLGILVVSLGVFSFARLSAPVMPYLVGFSAEAAWAAAAWRRHRAEAPH